MMALGVFNKALSKFLSNNSTAHAPLVSWCLATFLISVLCACGQDSKNEKRSRASQATAGNQDASGETKQTGDDTGDPAPSDENPSPQEPVELPPIEDGDLTRSLDCYGGEPESSLTRAALTDYRLRQIPAENLFVQANDSLISLCDHIRQEKKPLTFMTFVSGSCYSCMIWAESLLMDLKGTGVGITVVLVDEEGAFDEAELKALAADVAPDASWVRDAQSNLWSFFSDAQTVEPLLMVMDDFAQGFYVDGDETTGEVLEQANARMGFDYKISE